MRFLHTALWFAVGISPALAQRAPGIVVPGRPDVPVLMYGVDVSWSVINAVNPMVIYRPFAVVTTVPPPDYLPRPLGPEYFPGIGQRPGYGRLEVNPPPNRPLPPPAPTYFRGWSSQSSPGPTTEYAPFTEMPAYVSGGVGRRLAPPPLARWA